MFPGLSTEKPYDLDIRSFKVKGKTKEERATALAKEIEEAVKDTQRVIIRALPDKIIMSRTQYNLLSGQSELTTQEYDGQEFYLYRTKRNIMEVIIE